MADKIKYVPTPTELLKAQIYDNLMLYFKNIAINMFEWEGFPENISPDLISSEIIEEWLYEAGRAVFFKDNNYGYLCLKVQTQGQNIVGKPTRFVANGYSYIKSLTPDECVMIKNNGTSTPTRQLIQYYVEQIADIELLKKLRRNAHKTPIQVETSDETELTARNVWKKWDAGEPVIFKNKSRSGQTIGLNAVNTDVQYINNLLNDEENTYIANILTLLGISNYVEDKAERVQSAEVEAQQDYVQQSYLASFEYRQKACDSINKKFGLNLKVKKKEQQIKKPPILNESDFNFEDFGGDNNE